MKHYQDCLIDLIHFTPILHKHPSMRNIIITIVILLQFESQATASILLSNPTDACNALLEIDLKTTGWKNRGDSDFSCITPYRDIGTGFPLSNNIAYYAEGKSASVQLVKLVLNINQRSQARAAQKELLRAASLLAIKSTGKNLPQKLQNAITGGTSAIQKINQTTIHVIHTTWSTGLGYEVKVIFD